MTGTPVTVLVCVRLEKRVAPIAVETPAAIGAFMDMVRLVAVPCFARCTAWPWNAGRALGSGLDDDRTPPGFRLIQRTDIRPVEGLSLVLDELPPQTAWRGASAQGVRSGSQECMIHLG